jgi:dolichol-phosphate mannosyltransferase
LAAQSIVVIPTYNEADNLVPLVEAIRSAVPDIVILVVDDGSPDGTAALARSMGLRVIERASKLGLGSAYVAGFTLALEEGFTRIAGMDADFSHDPQVLPALLALLERYDVAVGARYLEGGGTVNWGWHRRALSKGANGLARAMLGMPLHDVTSGYRAYRREVLEAIQLRDLKSEGYAFLVELLFRCVQAGYTVGEVPIVFEDRRKGVSKLDKREIWRGAANLVRLWNEKTP